MNELRRLAYLEAMDIPSFISRHDLPGALPSTRLRINKAIDQVAVDSPLEASPVVPDAGSVAALMDAAPHRRQVPEPPVAAQAPRLSPPASEAPDVPVFTVVATIAGGWLWLDEIPAGRDPGSAYAALLGAVCRALSLPETEVQPQFFNYPVAAGTALEAGVDGARDALFGFISGRILRFDPERVVLLGLREQAWFDRACLDGRAVTETVSAFAMLRDPGLKAEAWRTLSALVAAPA
ncbi:MAG: hypothetical protein AAGI24_06860 [Pseudomonadota bacterium]